MKPSLALARAPAVEELEVEIVERKGRGHPDSICDALAEHLSRSLSRLYYRRFGRVLHHNVDKALLAAGASRPRFGGGEVTAPMEVFLAGRATLNVADEKIPVDDLAVETARSWLEHNLRWVDPERHVVVRPLIRRGSSELLDLYGRRSEAANALANDTSIGVGFFPLTRLERTVEAVEKRLNSEAVKERHPEIGEDVKVLGIRRGGNIDLTVATAMVDRFLPDGEGYLRGKEAVATHSREAALEVVDAPISVTVNAADDPGRGDYYLTVTGTSAEAGDDGQAGRGNRWNGLITPYRPMTLESVSGKNPVSHVGKLYQMTAQRLAEALVTEVGDIQGAECVLASRIGRPITEPEQVDVKLRLAPGRAPEAFTRVVEEMTRRELSETADSWREAVDGDLAGRD